MYTVSPVRPDDIESFEANNVVMHVALKPRL